MRSGNYHLVTAATMPDCVATAAVASHCLGFSWTLGPHTKDIDITPADHDTGRTLYVIGTFWKNQLTDWSKRFAHVKVYSFGDQVPVPDVCPNVQVFVDTSRKGSAAWILDQRHDVIDAVNPELLALINVRCFGEGDDRVQTFFTGIYDWAATPGLDLITIFIRVVSGGITVDQVLSRGQVLMTNHRGIAAERVRKGAMVAPRVVMVEGPELINLTHAALHKAYPDAIHTVVWRVAWDMFKDDHTLAISVRTWNEAKSALAFLSGIGDAGGSVKAAGTSGPFLDTWARLMQRIKDVHL